MTLSMIRSRLPSPRTLLAGAALALLGHGAALAATPLPSHLPSSCGKAPSGELSAQRIAAVTPSRSEPGLYEGPVWIKDALYFSDFSFSQGFPSRVRKLTLDGNRGRRQQRPGGGQGWQAGRRHPQHQIAVAL
jgi:gluconolactonase